MFTYLCALLILTETQSQTNYILLYNSGLNMQTICFIIIITKKQLFFMAVQQKT